MPTIRSKQTTTLKITRVKGTSSTGKDTHDYVNLSVNPELEDGDVLSIGQKLSNLQKYPVDGRTGTCFPLGRSSAICRNIPLTVLGALTLVPWQKNIKEG